MGKLDVWEPRILYAAFATGLLGSLLLLISISTPYWVTVEFPYSVHRVEPGRGEFYKTGHYHGLWRICRQEYVNNTEDKPHDRLYCRAMYLTLPDNITISIYDEKIMHYRRSAAFISLIGLALSLLAHGFTWYSLNQLRYMFKRLAATVHLIAGACCWVTVEVFKGALEYEKVNLKDIVPPGSTVDYGGSYAVCWVSVSLFIIVGIVIFTFSRKRKAGKARSIHEAKENEPVVLGRV